MKGLSLFVLLCLFTALMMSCKRAVIEQEVSVVSYCDQTYYVNTYVWVMELGSPVSLERQEFSYGVLFHQIDSVRAAQKERVMPCYNSVKACIEQEKKINK